MRLQGDVQITALRRNAQSPLGSRFWIERDFARTPILTGRGYGGAAALVAAFAIAVLASCSWVPFVGKKSDNSGPASSPACPIAVILKPLANTAVFRSSAGPELRPLDVAWYGVYSDVSVTCRMSGDTLVATLDNVIAAERGTAAHGNDVDFTYFVSLTASDQTILGKKSFGVHVAVPDKAKRGGVDDHIEIAFATGGRPVSDLQITAGFQQSPQAIEFYKHFRGR